MTLQYQAPTVPAQWANDRNTHDAVATAIHAIAGGNRTPELIWEDPTPAEWDHVAMAVENYVAAGLYFAEDDGRYHWGQEAIVIPAAAFATLNPPRSEAHQRRKPCKLPR